MQAYTYIEKGKFALVEKPKPTLIDSTDVSGHQYAGNERNRLRLDGAGPYPHRLYNGI